MITTDDVKTLSRITQSSINDTGEAVDDPLDVTPVADNEEYFVTERLCEAISDYLEDHTHDETCAYFGIGRATVYYHSSGRCQHNHVHIDAQRCAMIRGMAEDGWSNRELGEYFGCHHSTAGYHISGECACDHSVPPVERDELQNIVTSQKCDRLRSRFPDESAEELRKDLDLAGTNTVYRHVNGNCGCENSIEPVTVSR